MRGRVRTATLGANVERRPATLGVALSNTRPFTLWTVTRPEQCVRIEVSVRSAEEARRVAWQRWYRLPVRTDLDALMREAFGTDDTGVPAEKESEPVSSGAKPNAP